LIDIKRIKPAPIFYRKTVMPVTCTDFERCVNDRIAYYRNSYDQATRIYQELLSQNSTTEEDLADVQEFQQAMADEISRCRRLLIKYSLKRVPVQNKELVQINSVRLN
jgi:hypothetical protein